MPTNRGRGLALNGVKADLRACRSDSARCTACTAGVDVFVCAQYEHRVNADTVIVRLTYDGQGRLYFDMALTSGSLPAASCSPDGAVRLVINVFVFCLFLAALEHTDDAGVIEQRAPPQHIAASSPNRPTVPFPPGCRVRHRPGRGGTDRIA